MCNEDARTKASISTNNHVHIINLERLHVHQDVDARRISTDEVLTKSVNNLWKRLKRNSKCTRTSFGLEMLKEIG